MWHAHPAAPSYALSTGVWAAGEPKSEQWEPLFSESRLPASRSVPNQSLFLSYPTSPAQNCNLQVEGRIVSEIGPGLLVLVGVHESDTDSDADYVSHFSTFFYIFIFFFKFKFLLWIFEFEWLNFADVGRCWTWGCSQMRLLAEHGTKA